MPGAVALALALGACSCTGEVCRLEPIRGTVAATPGATLAWALEGNGVLRRVGSGRIRCPGPRNVIPGPGVLRVAGERAWVANERQLLNIRECEQGAPPIQSASFRLATIDSKAVEAFDDQLAVVFGKGTATEKGDPKPQLYAFDGQELRQIYQRGPRAEFSEDISSPPDFMVRSSDGEAIWMASGDSVCTLARADVLKGPELPTCQAQIFGARVTAISRARAEDPLWVGTEQGVVRVAGRAEKGAPGARQEFPVGPVVSVEPDAEVAGVAWAVVAPSTLYRLQASSGGGGTTEMTLDGRLRAVRSVPGRPLILLMEDGVRECLDCARGPGPPATRMLARGSFEEVSRAEGDGLWLSGAAASALCVAPRSPVAPSIGLAAALLVGGAVLWRWRVRARGTAGDPAGMREPPAPEPEEARDHVFLSYNNDDQAITDDLARLLSERGVKVYLYKAKRSAGRPWQKVLQRAIQEVKSGVILCGPTGFGRWQELEKDMLIDEHTRRGIPVIPVLLPGFTSEADLPPLLRQFNWVDLRAGLASKDIGALIGGVEGVPGQRPK